jgi:hypothetical protein
MVSRTAAGFVSVADSSDAGASWMARMPTDSGQTQDTMRPVIRLAVFQKSGSGICDRLRSTWLPIL